MGQRRPMISVVIPVRDAQEGLAACLDALERQTTPREDYEIIVVNDGPVSGEVETTARRHGAALLSQPRRGAGAARNLGARRAQGELLLFIDADCIPEPDWMAMMVAPFADQETMGVCGLIRTRQTAIIPRFIQLEYDVRYENIARYDRIDFINTGAAAYRRAVFMESGGFEETLLGAEDTELSYRLADRGYKMVFAPGAVVHHRHPASLLEYARRKYHYGYWRLIVYRRYPRKAVADSRTPQTQKLQIGLFYLLVAALFGTIFWGGFAWLAAGLSASFLFTVLPFWWRALKRDVEVGLLVPLLTLVSTASVGAGLMAGAIHECVHGPGSAVASDTEGGTSRGS